MMVGEYFGLENKIIKEKKDSNIFFLSFFFFLIPFDSYLGAQWSIPVVIIVYLIFLLLSVPQVVKGKLEINIYSIYFFYAFLVLLVGLFRVGFTYNNLLFISMFIFFVVAKNLRYGEEVFQSFLNLTPIIFFLFILLNLIHIEWFSDGIYMGIKNIVDPNYLISNLVLVLALFCNKIHIERKSKNKFIYGILIVFYFIVILLIGSRGGILSSITVVLVYYLLLSKKKWKAIGVIFTIGLVGIISAIIFLPDYLLERFSLIDMLGKGGSGRLTIWKNYLSVFFQQDFLTLLFGNGRDVASYVSMQKFDTNLYPHNIFIKTLIEGGIIGLVLIIGFLIYMLRKTFVSKNIMLFSALMGFIVGACFLDMDNMRVFWMIVLFSYINWGANQNRGKTNKLIGAEK